MKWTEQYRVSSQDVDLWRIASPSAIMRFMQDAANCHMEGAGASYDELFDGGRAFVISRFAMSLGGVIRSHDEIVVETWAAPSRAASFNRCYRVFCGGETVAEASAVWALVDVASGALVRVEDASLDYGEEEAIDIGAPIRFRIPAELPMSAVGRHLVTYADVDVNRHMNNTKYADMLCSYLPDAVDARRVREFSILFSSEAPLGDEIGICRAVDGDVCYFRTTRSDGRINVEARIALG